MNHRPSEHASKRIVKASKKLSWLLRHGAGEVGLTMDEAGWAPISEVLEHLGIDRQGLEEVAQQNDKARLQIDGQRVRACQGHSLAGMPVTREALEATWARFEGGLSIWHGTNVPAAVMIAHSGIDAGARTHVHLAPTSKSKVGKRFNTPVLLEVSVGKLRGEGLDVFESPNGVVLVRQVPPSCIIGLETTTKKANLRRGELRGLYGIAGAA